MNGLNSSMLFLNEVTRDGGLFPSCFSLLNEDGLDIGALCPCEDSSLLFRYLNLEILNVSTRKFKLLEPKAYGTIYLGKQEPGAMSRTSFVYSSKIDTDEAT